MDIAKLKLRKSIESDLDTFFKNQLDEESNQMAAFTAENPSDKEVRAEISVSGMWGSSMVIEGKTITPEEGEVTAHVTLPPRQTVKVTGNVIQ